ncbi:hypothetical protein LINGRAHAP2_LOCUS10407, partial [Linum grandiflorum]
WDFVKQKILVSTWVSPSFTNESSSVPINTFWIVWTLSLLVESVKRCRLRGMLHWLSRFLMPFLLMLCKLLCSLLIFVRKLINTFVTLFWVAFLMGGNPIWFLVMMFASQTLQQNGPNSGGLYEK